MALTGNFVPNGHEERLKGVLRFLGGRGGWGRGDISGFPRRKSGGGVRMEGANTSAVNDSDDKYNGNKNNDDDDDDDDMYLYNTFISRLRQKRPAVVPMLDKILEDLEEEWRRERERERERESEGRGRGYRRCDTVKKRKKGGDAGWWRRIRGSIGDGGGGGGGGGSGGGDGGGSGGGSGGSGGAGGGADKEHPAQYRRDDLGHSAREKRAFGGVEERVEQDDAGEAGAGAGGRGGAFLFDFSV